MDMISKLIELTNSNLPFSDIHIEQDMPVMLKFPLGWKEAEGVDIPSISELEELLKTLDTNYREVLVKHAINRSINLSQWRLRINAFLMQCGEKVGMSIRRLSLHPLPLDKTGLPMSLNLMLESPRGIIFVTGSTGSGKSTTIAAMIDAKNQSSASHIITIEDPIEYLHPRKKALITQREVGPDVGSFNEGVKDAMRQRPDVIMIGEIRDRDTAETAILAGESGHLVIASVHGNSAAGAIQKMLSFFPGQEREAKAISLSANTVGIINQILLPTMDGKGYALAAEVVFNHKQQFTKVLTDPDRLNAALERRDDKISIPMMDSLSALVRTGKVSKADAVAAAVGNVALYEKLTGL